MKIKWIDLPPIWLLGGLVVLLVWRPLDPVALGGWARWPGMILFGTGLALTIFAVLEMTRHNTTVIPHKEPQALVTSGVFQISRNPIYLGDALMLAGVALWLGTGLGLILVPIFMTIITRRFIRPEETKLRRHFGADFDAWAATTRAWL